MRFPGKARREAQQQAAGGRIEFSNYSWDGLVASGWFRAATLDVEEGKTKKGDAMLVVDFGLHPPDGRVGGKIRHYVPENYLPKVTELVGAFKPESLETDEDVELTPADVKLRWCAVLVEEDRAFVRRDGKPTWRITRVMSLADAEEQLGADWEQATLTGDKQDEDNGADLF